MRIWRPLRPRKAVKAAKPLKSRKAFKTIKPARQFRALRGASVGETKKTS